MGKGNSRAHINLDASFDRTKTGFGHQGVGLGGYAGRVRPPHPLGDPAFALLLAPAHCAACGGKSHTRDDGWVEMSGQHKQKEEKPGALGICDFCLGGGGGSPTLEVVRFLTSGPELFVDLLHGVASQ